MSAFDNCEFDVYQTAAKKKWGKTEAYQQHAEKTKNYSRQKRDNLSADMDRIMAGLGQMYVADERFKNNIDKHADGTAAFIRQAIEGYCRK